LVLVPLVDSFDEFFSFLYFILYMMDQMIANPAMGTHSTLVATTLVIAYGAGCVYFLSLHIIPPMLEAVSNSNVTTAQVEQIDDLVPDIFDEDLDPEVVAGLNEAYDDDD
jgi:hypothetical protein